MATQQVSIEQMFDGQSLFITGASGFIGRVLLEKLLRCYPGIKTIYILMRTKKNVSPQDRLHKQLLKVPIFDNIKSMDNGQELLNKITVIPGDIGESNLGISSGDLNRLIGDPTLSIVFHSAATVKFDEPLKLSVKFNLIATRTVLEICRRLPNLISLCHVSTAYVNSDQRDNQIIEEKLYPIKEDPQMLIKLAEYCDENLMQLMKPTLLGNRPNTYTYTKALAEHLIALDAPDLPVAIVRPSIVVAAHKKPLPGWIDNLNGPTGLILAIGKGLLRTLYVNREVKADIIPVDCVVDTMVAASYYAAKTNDKLKKSSTNDTLPEEVMGVQRVQNSNGSQQHAQLVTCSEERLEEQVENVNDAQVGPTEMETRKQEVPIFHCNSGDINPITWGNMEDLFFPIIRHYPSQQVLRYPFGTFKGNKYHDMITRLFVHYLPALIIDLLCLIMGKKRQLLFIYDRLHSATKALEHFCNTNYNFQTKGADKLKACLCDEDRNNLMLDIKSLDWYKFFDGYVLGARRYVLKEPDETLEESRKSFKKAYYIEIVLRSLLLLTAAYFVLPASAHWLSPTANPLSGALRALNLCN